MRPYRVVFRRTSCAKIPESAESAPTAGCVANGSTRMPDTVPQEPSRVGLARLRTTPRRQQQQPPTSGPDSRQQAASERPWTPAELELLAGAVCERASVLLSGNDLSVKRSAWEELSKRLQRPADALRRQWTNIVVDLRQNKRSTPFKPHELAALKALNSVAERSRPQPPAMPQQQQEPPQLQIDPNSVRSIPANSFLHQEKATRAAPAMSTAAVAIQSTASITIMPLNNQLNREVSITPVKKPQPQRASSSHHSSDELQVVRTCSSVHTQTPEKEEPSAKRARLGSSSQADTAAILQRLASLEERRFSLQREQLAVERDKVQCMRELLALLKTDRAAAVTNGDAVAAAVSAAL